MLAGEFGILIPPESGESWIPNLSYRLARSHAYERAGLITINLRVFCGECDSSDFIGNFAMSSKGIFWLACINSRCSPFRQQQTTF